MKPFELPFSAFIELSRQIDLVIADEIASGHALIQSKEGVKILEKRINQTRVKVVKQISTKEKERDEKLYNDKFKKIRELKRRLGGKLRPLTDKDRQELKHGT